ncbi:MAG: acyl-CoA thioesterase [Gemmatimonadaceae bacterium]|nr:acyl-CoA thioesterase [Gemmatimonadaceae bacterium]
MTTAAPFLTEERVRWADVDLVGIMRFSACTRLIETAEQECMRAAGFAYSTLFDAPTFWMPRRHLSIEYFAPARIDEALSLVTYVSRVGYTSWTLNVDIRSTTTWTLIASATMTVVCVTAERFEKTSIPADFRAALAPFTVDRDVALAWRP